MEIKKLLKALGPGILFASTCIGVSHLVQSTRAGAEYGFILLGAVVIANVLKYPFFQFASRYAGATGKSIIDGYEQLGRWTLYLYFVITIPSMLIVTAAVTFVTAGMLGNLFQIELSTPQWSIVVLLICTSIIIIGKYSLLDNLLKVVGIVLVISVVIAFVSALIHGPVQKIEGFVPKEVFEKEGIIFLIALMGWMPTAVDISTWPSLWAEEKMRVSGYRPGIKEVVADFNIGYWITAFLAICFLSLGALIIYGTGTELSNSSTVFADQVISMFTVAIGDWSYFVIAIAAFSTMFSTTVTVIDGYGRAITRTTKLILRKGEKDSRKAYLIWILISVIGSWLIISQFSNQLKALVDLATIFSFVLAPVIAIINYKVINHKHLDTKYHPKKPLNILAIAGIVYLSVFTIIYIIVYFF